MANPMTLRLIKMLGYASVINVSDRVSGAGKGDSRNGVHVHENTTYRQFVVDNVDDIDESQIQRFSKLLDDIPKPVFVFSNKGLRATAICAASMISHESWQDIDAAAARAGHDVSFLLASESKKTNNAGSGEVMEEA
jgi:protein tyrosine phosphatase (PTP) superfamily phosphohydrolase (DUF442 family)